MVGLDFYYRFIRESLEQVPSGRILQDFVRAFLIHTLNRSMIHDNQHVYMIEFYNFLLICLF